MQSTLFSTQASSRLSIVMAFVRSVGPRWTRAWLVELMYTHRLCHICMGVLVWSSVQVGGMGRWVISVNNVWHLVWNVYMLLTCALSVILHWVNLLLTWLLINVWTHVQLAPISAMIILNAFRVKSLVMTALML